MSRKLVRDESGVVLGLAVIMIVLIGVLGAGLLVFVQQDLKAVVEVNQGQKAMDAADAGFRAAKRQLLSDANRRHYDLDFSNDCGSGAPGDSSRTGDDWSPSPNSPNSTCSSSTAKTSVGATRDFAEATASAPKGRFTVTIQCFDQLGDVTDVCSGVSETAPENVAASDKAFFKVVSTGYYPASGNGARRKVEAIFNTYDLGVPKAYFTPNDITVTGTADITDVSLFSLGNVTLNGGADVKGTDLAYGKWNKPPYNIVERVSSNAGIGAVGEINSEVLGEDYDGADGSDPRFVKDPSSPQGSSQITFPFDYKTQAGVQDKDRLDFLREEALANGIYRTSSGGVVDVGTDFAWPANAKDDTVVFVEFTSAGGTNRVDWSVGNNSDPPVKGTLVVNGGDFKQTQNQACLEGVVIVRGGVYEDGSAVDAGGNTCLDGFVNATGAIEIKGNVDPIAPGAVINRPGFYGVRLWSWRELYE